MTKKLSLALCLLIAAPLAAYIPQRRSIDGTVTAVRWSTASFPIEWRMNPTVGQNVTGSREQADVFRDAFAEWADISTAAISFTEGSTTNIDVKPGFDQINLITTNVTALDFNSGAVGLTGAFSFDSTGLDEFGRTIEFKGQIIEADIMFNPGTIFSTSPTTPGGFIDLQSVATHEVGHLLGLDHSNILSSTMFPTIVTDVNFPRNAQIDDRSGVSSIYPDASFTQLGALGGTVRTTGNEAVFGALVVVLDTNGQAVASAVTDPNGQYTIQGLSAGTYTVYAEPMNQPFSTSDAFSLSFAYPGQTVNSSFTVRYR